MDGILNLNKPIGITSAKAVSLVKKLSGERRVGHAGTLDPMASGVLPLGLGRGTRMLEFLLGAPKTYLAQLLLGVTTDTYDSEGKVTSRGDVSSVSRERLEEALKGFCGLIEQTPPLYSAVKQEGRRLYELARAGIAAQARKRLVNIYEIRLVDFNLPLVSIEVVCGRGTYIRSLVHDLGQSLGCGACLRGLVRLRYGDFTVEDALSFSQLEKAVAEGYFDSLLYPIDVVLSSSPRVEVGEDEERFIRQGRVVALDIGEAQGYVRAYTSRGRFLAVLKSAPGGRWQPEKVFL